MTEGTESRDPSPPVFSEGFILKDFKSNGLGSSESKRGMPAVWFRVGRGFLLLEIMKGGGKIEGATAVKLSRPLN